MRRKVGDPNWQRPEGYVWNHAGRPGSKTMELVRRDAHRALSHKGPAAVLRATARSTTQGGSTQRRGIGGTTARAVGIAGVYLMARDLLRMSAASGPEYHSDEGFTYKFEDAKDGSEFIVKPGWIRSARGKFVSGPRKGQSEPITDEEVENYKKAAEEEFGKYVPGKSPRFIPGARRSHLDVFDYDERGLRRTLGTIRQNGVHLYPLPRIEA